MALEYLMGRCIILPTGRGFGTKMGHLRRSNMCPAFVTYGFGYPTPNTPGQAVIAWIETFYNTHRVQTRLGRLPPHKYAALLLGNGTILVRKTVDIPI